MKEYLINGKKYRLNVFEKITNPNEAYLIGYLCGDGGYQKHTHKRLARLSVSSSDEYIINSFKNEFCPDNQVGSRLPINKTRAKIVSNKLAYVLNFSSKFHNTFNKFGILSKKEDRKTVNISKKMFRYYLLGLFDADGHISWGKRKDRDRLWCNFVITHQSMSVLAYVQNMLHEHLNISTSIRPRTTENCLDLKISNMSSVAMLYEYLYKGLSCELVHNYQKENHFCEFVFEYNSK